MGRLTPSALDAQLRGLLDMNRITPIDAGPSHSEARVGWGRHSCSTKCSAGAASQTDHLIPRNAPEVFNRGSAEWGSIP